MWKLVRNKADSLSSQDLFEGFRVLKVAHKDYSEIQIWDECRDLVIKAWWHLVTFYVKYAKRELFET
jgi:hypothetical protein